MKRHKHLQSLAAHAILFVTMAVAVVHANAAPPTLDVDNPGRDPFQESFVVILPSGVANDGVFEVVPPGKRAVIEHVSVYARGTNAATADYFITSTIGGGSAFREVPIVTALSPSGAVIGSQSYRAFADPQTQFGAVIRRLDTTNPVGATFVITGYFVRAP